LHGVLHQAKRREVEANHNAEIKKLDDNIIILKISLYKRVLASFLEKIFKKLLNLS